MNTLDYQYQTINHNGVPKSYIDFWVDGVSLRALLKEFSNIGLLAWEANEAYDTLLIDEYLQNKKSTLKSGRYVIYGCRECGDINCGAITMQIEIEKNKVTWKNFAFETDYDAAIFEDYQHIKPIEFGLDEYKKVFKAIKKELD